MTRKSVNETAPVYTAVVDSMLEIQGKDKRFHQNEENLFPEVMQRHFF